MTKVAKKETAKREKTTTPPKAKADESPKNSGSASSGDASKDSKAVSTQRKKDFFETKKKPANAQVSAETAPDSFKPSQGGSQLSLSTSPEESKEGIGQARFFDREGKFTSSTKTEILSDGQLVIEPSPSPALDEVLPVADPKSGPSKVSVGTINGTGHYSLELPDSTTKQSGNLFDEEHPLKLYSVDSPLRQSLSQAELEHAQKNAIGALLPKSLGLDSAGNPLDGSGTRILTHDYADQHQVATQHIINEVAPGASVKPGVSGDFSSNYAREWDPTKTFSENKSLDIKTIIDSTRQNLSGHIATYHPDVVSISIGASQLELAAEMVNSLGSPEMASYVAKDSEVAKIASPQTSYADKIKMASGYIDGLFDSNPELQSSLKEWNSFVESATDNGTTFVFSAGNHGDEASQYGLTNGEGIMMLAGTPNVITVAGSKSNNTPSLKDDSISTFSSQGSPGKHPTIAAPVKAVVGKGLIGVAVNDNGVTWGTSFSAPAVAATIAVMKQKNPHLSFEQIHSILTNTAVDTEAPVELEGAGVMDPAAAIAAVPAAE